MKLPSEILEQRVNEVLTEYNRVLHVKMDYADGGRYAREFKENKTGDLNKINEYIQQLKKAQRLLRTWNL